MSRDLAALRTQLPSVDRDQAATGREKHQRAKAGPAGDYGTKAPPLTPDEASAEDEHARAEAQTQAQIEALEGTLFGEDADPGWADAAQSALQEAFHRGAVAGLSLIQADCRTSLCRLELSLEGARLAEAIFQQLMDFTSWNGEGFTQIDEASGTSVVYLSREGYALPQARE